MRRSANTVGDGFVHLQLGHPLLQAFSTAFTAPGYNHSWAEQQFAAAHNSLKTGALHEIEYPRGHYDTWGKSEEEKAEATRRYHEDLSQFHHQVSKETGLPHPDDVPEGEDEHGRSHAWLAKDDLKQAWETGIHKALTYGHLDIQTAKERGYYGDHREMGEQDRDENYKEITRPGTGWRPMPAKVYHVGTDTDAIEREGLKTRHEQGGVTRGLGGGTNHTVSVTSDPSLGPDIYHSLHEHHAVIRGDITPHQLKAYAEKPPKGEPFWHAVVQPGSYQENDFNDLTRGVKSTRGGMGDKDEPGFTTDPKTAHETHPGWRPIGPPSTNFGGPDRPRHERWERDLTPEETSSRRSELYKSFSFMRGHYGGHRDPLFMSNDPHAFGKTDPAKFGILHLKTHPGAQGYTLSSGGEHHAGADSGEWRTGGSPFDVEKVERPRPRHLDEFGLGDKTSAADHDVLYHITDNPHFNLDPKHVPEDNTFALEHRQRPGLFTTKPNDSWGVEHWVNGQNYVRPYVAEIHAPKDAHQPGRWGGEHFIPAENFGKATVHRVIPLDAHARETYGEHGWIEGHHSTEFDTGDKIPREYSQQRKFPDYHYDGPDAREMTPEQHQFHKERALSYLKGNRGFDDEDIESLRHHWGMRKTADDDDYRMHHRPPDRDGIPLHDLTQGGPHDTYETLHHYNPTGDPYDESWGEARAAIHKAHGNPDAKIRIYRSLPAEHAHQGFRPGDWVTTSKAYARLHGMHQEDPKHDWPVIRATVRAGDLHTDMDDLREWGYNGDAPKNGMVSYKGGYHQEVSQHADGIVRKVIRRQNGPHDPDLRAEAGRGKPRRDAPDVARRTGRPAADSDGGVGQDPGGSAPSGTDLPLVIHPKVGSDVAKLPKPVQNVFNDRLDSLRTGQTHPSTHALHGPLKAWQSTNLNFQYRMIHKRLGDAVHVISVGNHDESYNAAIRRDAARGNGFGDTEAHISVAENIMQQQGHGGRDWHVPALRHDDPQRAEAHAPVNGFVQSVLIQHGMPEQDARQVKVQPKHWDTRQSNARASYDHAFHTIGLKGEDTNDLELLHECAHAIRGHMPDHTDGHDKTYARIAHDMYAKHLGPDAADIFRTVVEPKRMAPKQAADDSSRVWYHGTSVEHAQDILANGARKGFNVVTLQQHANNYARTQARFHSGYEHGVVLEGRLDGNEEDHPWDRDSEGKAHKGIAVTNRSHAFTPTHWHEVLPWEKGEEPATIRHPISEPLPSKEAAARTESVQHILTHYRPTDFDTWDEVRNNFDWDHPKNRAFVEDVRRNGVQRPIPVDYESDPPRVMNGHTRLLAAERAGVTSVPTRQHEGWMDPDDPDHMGRGPDDPEHWTNKQASVSETLYHGTTPFRRDMIHEQGFHLPGKDAHAADYGHAVYLTNDHDFAKSYGGAVVSATLKPGTRIAHLGQESSSEVMNTAARHQGLGDHPSGGWWGDVHTQVHGSHIERAAKEHGYHGVTDGYVYALYDPDRLNVVRTPKQAAHLGLQQHEWDELSRVQDVREQSLDPRECYQVSRHLADRLGWTQESGSYRGTGHYWNRKSDGTIIDATHDQFDPDDDPVRIVPPGHPAQSEYRSQLKEAASQTARFTPRLRVFTKTCGLDHRLWNADGQLKPEAREYIMQSVATMWAGKYLDWSKWARVYFAGSEASEWTSDTLEGNNDFDVLIGVDYRAFRQANPAYLHKTNTAITDEMNHGFREFNGEVMLTIDGLQTGPWDRTTFVNRDSYDIRKIKPYAAYDVTNDEWVVRPPHLPHWSIDDLPKPVVRALRAADAYAHSVLKLPEPARTQQGAALFDAWHSDRSRAFSERGEGWFDIANLREKWLDQEGIWAEIVNCKHRANEGLDLAPADWSNTPPGYVATKIAASGFEEGNRFAERLDKGPDEEPYLHPRKDEYFHDYVAPGGQTYRLLHGVGAGGDSAITAHHQLANGKYRGAGYLSWFPGQNRPDDERSNINGGMIHKVFVAAPHRHRGLASAMLDFGREKRPDLRHSNALSDDGRAWAEKKAKKLPKTEKCNYCDQQATGRVLWAEGMAYIPTCDAHEQKAIDHVGEDEYCNTRPIPKQAARFQPGGEFHTASYGDYLSGGGLDRAREHLYDQPQHHVGDEWNTPQYPGTVGWVKTDKMLAMRHHDGSETGRGPEVVHHLTEGFKNGEGWINPLQLNYAAEDHKVWLGEGNHRLEAAHRAGEPYVPVTIAHTRSGELPSEYREAPFGRTGLTYEKMKALRGQSGSTIHPEHVLPPHWLHGN